MLKRDCDPKLISQFRPEMLKAIHYTPDFADFGRMSKRDFDPKLKSQFRPEILNGDSTFSGFRRFRSNVKTRVGRKHGTLPPTLFQLLARVPLPPQLPHNCHHNYHYYNEYGMV
jgi:hypothetical protein